MSASSIRDATITMCRAASFMGTTNVARHYGVLESSSGSAIVCEIAGLEQVEQVFADKLHQDDWSISVRMYSKDTGDPAALDARSSCMIDLLAGTIRADPTLLGTVERVARLTIERPLPPEGFVEAGGALWQETQAIIECEEWPDG